MDQFVNRIKNFLKRWIALSSCEETFDGILDLVIMEQFMNVCGRNLQVYLNERSPLPFAEMIELADQFVAAHGGLLNNSQTHRANHLDEPDAQKVGFNNSVSENGKKPERKQERVEPKKLVCFRCDRPDHKAYQCKERKKQIQVSGCEEVCAKEPELATVPVESVKTDTRTQIEASSSGPVVEVINAIACMPVVRGTVCGVEGTTLRDTGCSTVVVRKNLVPSSKFTGKSCLVRLANCVVERYPLAQVDIECPYYTGTVYAICMEEPIYDVLIGNIPGALPLQDIHSTPETSISAVETRASAQKPLHPRKQLKVPDFQAILSVGKKAFQEAQQEDPSLKTWWEFHKEGKIVAKGKGKLIVEKGLFCRMMETRDKQLVVPEKFR